MLNEFMTVVKLYYNTYTLRMGGLCHYDNVYIWFELSLTALQFSNKIFVQPIYKFEGLCPD